MLEKLKHTDGYIILEFLIVAAILAATASIFYIPSKTLIKNQIPIQVRVAAKGLAADIRAFQQNIMFSDSAANKIILFDNKEGYIIETNNGQKRYYVDFNKNGCKGVYFDKYSSNSISFSSSGAPKNNTAGDYILKHHDNSDFACKLTIQVSSGRVDLSEV